MAVIRKVTEIPGPKALAILQRQKAAVPQGVACAARLVVASAHGSVVEDVDGNRFIDFAGGIGVLNVLTTATAESYRETARNFCIVAMGPVRRIEHFLRGFRPFLAAPADHE